MFIRWVQQYQSFMERTRLISQLGAFWFSLLSIINLSSLCYAVYRNYELVGSELFWHSVEVASFLVLIFIVFGIRFILLYRLPIRHYIFVPISWFLGAILLTAYLLCFDYSFWIRGDSSSFGIYDIREIDPFITQGPIFIFASVLRFLVTAVLAFVRRR